MSTGCGRMPGSVLPDLLPPEAIAKLAESCSTCGGKGYRRLASNDPCPTCGSDDERLAKAPCPDCADRTVYLNVRSEKACPLTDPTDCNGEHCDCPWVAPPEWVKLAEATCETCDGNYRVGDFDNGSPICLDCHEGKPVHTISVPCPNGCYPVATGPCGACATYPHGLGGPHFNTGTVEYRVVVTELLPVVDRLRAEKDGGYVIVKPNHVRLYYVTGNGRYRYITVAGEPPDPGDHVAVIEVLT